MRHYARLLLCILMFGLFHSILYAQVTAENTVKTPETDLVTEKAKESTVRLVGLSSGGTGFFVAPDKIVTNFHVAAGMAIGPITAKLNHKDTIWLVEGVVAFDIKSDIAILKIKGEGVALTLADIDTLQIGETVYLAGYPELGEFKIVGGVVKDIRSSDKWLKTTVEAYPGNSGGPMLNSRGEAIGIHVGHGYDARPSSAIRTLLDNSIAIQPLAEWRQRKTVRAYVHYMKGWQKYIIDGNVEKAIADFNQAIALNPDDLDVYMIRGDAKSKLGDFKGAIEDYEHVLKLNPDALDIRKKRDEMKLLIEGQLQQNGKVVRQTTTQTVVRQGRSSGDDVNYKELGHKKSAEGNYTGAIGDFTQAIKLKSDDVDAYNARGWAKLQNDDYAGAIEDFSQVIKYRPQNANAYIQRAQVRLKLKHFIEAIEDYNHALRLNPDDSYFILNARGRVRLESGDHNGAIKDFSEAIKLLPNRTYGYNSRGLALRTLGDYSRAIEDHTHAINLEPAEPNSYRLRGHAKVEFEDYIGAIEDYTQAIKLKSEGGFSTYFAYIERGNAKRLSKNFDGAIVDYNHAIMQKPEHADVYNARGLTKVDLKDYEGAVLDYDKAIKLNPKFAKAYHNRGLAKEALGHHETAKVDFEKAKEIDPDVGK